MNKSINELFLETMKKTMNKSVNKFLESYDSKLSKDEIKYLIKDMCYEERINCYDQLQSSSEIYKEKKRHERFDENKNHQLKLLNSKRELLFKKLNNVDKTIYKIKCCECNDSVKKQMNIFYRNYDFEINNTKHRVII